MRISKIKTFKALWLRILVVFLLFVPILLTTLGIGTHQVHAETQTMVIGRLIDEPTPGIEPETIKQATSVGAAAAVALTILSFGTFDLLGYLTKLGIAIAAFIGIRGKAVPYGFVYDAVTKRRLSLAILRFYDKRGKLVSTSVSDSFGSFAVDLPPGVFTLKVKKAGYRHPSNLITSNADPPIGNVLSGSTFTKLANLDTALSYAIPLDPVDVSLTTKLRVKLFNLFQKALYWLATLLLISTVLSSILLVLIQPTVWNWLLLVIVLLSMLLMWRLRKVKKAKLGRVLDVFHRPVAGLSIGLKDFEFGKLVDKQITDVNGEYRFITAPGKYKLEILSEEYKWADGGNHVYSWNKSTPLVITDELIVVKA